MVDQPHVTAPQAGPAAVVSCWLCGIHLPAAQMVADGNAACADLRWYCRDTRGCTERWTSPRPARQAGTTPAPKTGKKKKTGSAAAQPAPTQA
jgi:hypothetical protein